MNLGPKYGACNFHGAETKITPLMSFETGRMSYFVGKKIEIKAI